MSHTNTIKVCKTSRENVEGGDTQFIGDAILAQPLEVKIYNGNFERALKAFRALVQKERILSVYKDRQSYEKPSQKRRRKKNEMTRKFLEAHSPFHKGKSDE